MSSHYSSPSLPPHPSLESLRACFITRQPIVSQETGPVTSPAFACLPSIGPAFTGGAEAVVPHWHRICGFVSLIRYRV
jgi:hypothetical protein